jgi:hypothetical protein
MRNNFLGVITYCASVPSVADGELGPGVRQGYAAVGFVGAAF